MSDDESKGKADLSFEQWLAKKNLPQDDPNRRPAASYGGGGLGEKTQSKGSLEPPPDSPQRGERFPVRREKAGKKVYDAKTFQRFCTQRVLQNLPAGFTIPVDSELVVPGGHAPVFQTAPARMPFGSPKAATTTTPKKCAPTAAPASPASCAPKPCDCGLWPRQPSRDLTCVCVRALAGLCAGAPVGALRGTWAAGSPPAPRQGPPLAHGAVDPPMGLMLGCGNTWHPSPGCLPSDAPTTPTGGMAHYRALAPPADLPRAG
eukprot:gene7454-183_t